MIDSRIPWWREPAARVAEPAGVAESATHLAEATPGDPVKRMMDPRQSAGFSFWALMGFTFILLLAPQERFPVLAPLRIAMLTAVLAMVAHAFSRVSHGLPIIRFNTSTLLVLGLVGWALITAPFSHWPGGSVAFLLETFSKTVIVFILIANVIDSHRKLQLVCWGLVLMSIPLSMTTVANYLSGTSLHGGDRVLGYSSGLTANPNDLALMLNLLLPLCIALLLASGSAAMRILLAGIAGLLVIAIIATFSRAGFLTLMVTGLTYLWFYRNRAGRAWIPVIVVLGLLALPLIPSGYQERISTIVNVEDDATHSASNRLGDMKAALRLSAANPLVGAGIGMNVLVLNELRGETWTAVHNVYLQILVELGLPGLLLFLLLYGRCFRATGNALRSEEADRSTGLFHIAEGLRVSLIAFGVAAMFHPVAYHFYFYIFAGLAIAAEAICAAPLASKMVPRVRFAGQGSVAS